MVVKIPKNFFNSKAHFFFILFFYQQFLHIPFPYGKKENPD